MPADSCAELPFFFEPRHRELAAAFGPWVDEQLAGFDAEEGGDGIAARRIFERLAAGGWLASAMTRDANGRVDLRAACLLRETLAARSAIADVAFSEPWLAALPIALFGSTAQQRQVRRFIDGESTPAFALSEPGAGSDVAAIQATATPRPDGGYVIEGRKTWTSNAGIADLYVVFARIGGEPGARGIAAFVVDGRHPGVRLDERLAVLPPHTVGTLHFDQCEVDESALLGAPGGGFRIAMTALELFRPTVGAATLGMARRALAEALARAQERVAFKAPLAEHQLIRAKLADMRVQIDAAALLVYRAAWSHDMGAADAGVQASIAKLYATEAAQRVVDEAQQIFGGLGVLRGTTVERLYRHVRAFRIFDGTSEIQRLIIARHLLGG